jgi:GH15 family glucan-1,4-alpha-glucosidase
MPIEEKRPKNDPMIDVGEKEGADVELDNNEQTKAVAEEKKEEKVELQKEENPVVDSKEEKAEVKKPIEKKVESKKDDLDEYSKDVKKRIAKLTFAIREAERQKEEAIQFAQSVKREKDQIEFRLNKTDKVYVSEFENRVKSSLVNAKIALKSAIDARDVDAQVAAQEQIAQLTMESARLSALKAAQEDLPVQKEVTINPQQVVQQPKTDPKAEEWASRNAWFGNDSAMTYTAFDLHKKLVEEEGYDPRSDEYYNEIDNRIRLEFPHKFATKESTTTTERAKPAQTVASASRPTQTGRKKTVSLTPSQVAIAKRLGVPLEEYAKHLTTKEA